MNPCITSVRRQFTLEAPAGGGGGVTFTEAPPECHQESITATTHSATHMPWVRAWGCGGAGSCSLGDYASCHMTERRGKAGLLFIIIARSALGKMRCVITAGNKERVLPGPQIEKSSAGPWMLLCLLLQGRPSVFTP